MDPTHPDAGCGRLEDALDGEARGEHHVHLVEDHRVHLCEALLARRAFRGPQRHLELCAAVKQSVTSRQLICTELRNRFLHRLAFSTPRMIQTVGGYATLENVECRPARTPRDSEKSSRLALDTPSS